MSERTFTRGWGRHAQLVVGEGPRQWGALVGQGLRGHRQRQGGWPSPEPHCLAHPGPPSSHGSDRQGGLPILPPKLFFPTLSIPGTQLTPRLGHGPQLPSCTAAFATRAGLLLPGPLPPFTSAFSAFSWKAWPSPPTKARVSLGA